MGDRRRRRKVQADDVAPADRDALTARAECVWGVVWGDRVSSIHEAREGVTTAGVRSGRRAGRSAERHRRATAARVRADRPGNAVGGARKPRRRKVHADDVAPADRDALTARAECVSGVAWGDRVSSIHQARERDRKSTRLNSSHGYISYA